MYKEEEACVVQKNTLTQTHKNLKQEGTIVGYSYYACFALLLYQIQCKTHSRC